MLYNISTTVLGVLRSTHHSYHGPPSNGDFKAMLTAMPGDFLLFPPLLNAGVLVERQPFGEGYLGKVRLVERDCMPFEVADFLYTF